MTDYLPTGVRGISAQHLTLTAQATGRRADLTLVWSTRPLRCCETQPVIRMDDPPPVRDATGRGGWDWSHVGQCGQCGRLMMPIARLRVGHLHGAVLTAVAQSVRAEQDAETARERAELRAALAAQAKWVAEHGDLRYVPELDSMAEPGVGRYTDDDGRTVLVAWDYDPGNGDVVEEQRTLT